MIKVILDGAGGDNPSANSEAFEAIQGKYEDLEVVLTGSMEEAFDLLSSGDDYSALVSMGDTRSLVIGAMNKIGMREGIIRPVFCPVLPTFNDGLVGLCDSGAIINVTPEHLLQYARLGSEYMRRAHGIENPRVGLLNIGTENDKGDDLHRKAFELLSTCEEINFLGNMESREYLSGKYDLVVSDGFSGNVMIKAVEGACEGIIRRFWRYLPPEELGFINYHNYGGSAMLGVNKLIIKAHGSSDKTALTVSIEQAYRHSKL